ncbi:carbohydrate porin [Acinetobacter sp. ANC 4648]|uniref:carbohydrate porin n=1 Tax=Acinetobacter sp. ANC 4648 TaxID=1977875 RepID=UPI000A333D56|nr:carbohydrate porin [Acinetobacter sp. ANC 4648]OTG83943.1 carbohydrate porin [Acinetobacter sp. ANC 4648]
MKKNTLSVLAILITTLMSHAYAQNAFDSRAAVMTGDWNGTRTEFAEQGVKFDANIAMDSSYLANGGYDAHQAATFASQFWLGTTLDMNQLAGWQGITIRGVITARQGQSTTVNGIQNPAAPQWANSQANWGRGNSGSRLSELSIEKNFAEQGVNVKVGRLGLGTDFNTMACDFQNNAFCAAQMGKWQGKIWYNTPVSQWGGRVKYQINPELFAQVGVYEYNPENALERHGWNLDTRHADGVNIPAEVVWSPKQAVNALPASYRFGVLYNTANDAKNQYDIAYKAGAVGEDRTYGGWISFEQQLTSAGTGRRGLHSFGNFTFHDRTTTAVDQSQQLGLKYIGLFDAQPNDILGLAVNRVHLNDRYRATKAILNKSAEYNIELNYSYYPAKWLMLRPLVQYVMHPGATDKVDNALVIGFGSKIIF